ncbi:MAG: hypothetical protein QW838_04140 [Candidatus Nitrosotenuis sp.]
MKALLAGLLALLLALELGSAGEVAQKPKPTLDSSCFASYIRYFYDPSVGRDADWVIAKTKANCIR